MGEISPTWDRPVCAYSLTWGGSRLGARAASGEKLGDHAKIRVAVLACRKVCGMSQVPLAHASKTH